MCSSQTKFDLSEIKVLSCTVEGWQDIQTRKIKNTYNYVIIVNNCKILLPLFIDMKKGEIRL